MEPLNVKIRSMLNAECPEYQYATNGASRLYILKVRIKTFVIMFTVFPRVWL